MLNKKEDILEKLNYDYTEFDFYDDIFIMGEKFLYSEDPVYMRDDVTATLISENFSFSRKGIKQYEYDSWVDTCWFDWE